MKHSYEESTASAKNVNEEQPETHIRYRGYQGFLTKNKLLLKAQSYLKIKWDITIARRKVSGKKKISAKEYTINADDAARKALSRDIFIDKINKIRAAEGKPLLQVIEREPDLEMMVDEY
ncbi:hypothetical protein J4482_00860 [Candidatus Woesearchaeota archaeon]|nr:hypothetical protein [Candidatus Woesearchaeota archaeon]